MHKLAAITLQNLTKSYQSVKNSTAIIALDNINLTILEGSFFALLGPNGAGKSTIINILAGTVNKTSGEAYIMDANISTQSNYAKSLIGVVPQELVMDTFFPIYEALEIYAGYYGIAPKMRKTMEIINALGLYDKRNHSAKQLSGGMKRRFLVAKAMVHSPKVLILDEPTAGVDIDLREQLWSYVTKLNKEGTTIILTTHYLEEVEKYCDQVAFINKGKIIKNDSKANLINELGLRKLRIELTDKIEQIPAEFSKYNIHKITDDILEITYRHNELNLNEIIATCNNVNLQIKDLVSKQASMEEIFKKLVHN